MFLVIVLVIVLNRSHTGGVIFLTFLKYEYQAVQLGANHAQLEQTLPFTHKSYWSTYCQSALSYFYVGSTDGVAAGFISLPLCAMSGIQTNISRVVQNRDLCKDALPTKPTDGNHATRAVVVAQQVQRLLSSAEICSSNLNIGKILSANCKRERPK